MKYEFTADGISFRLDKPSFGKQKLTADGRLVSEGRMSGRRCLHRFSLDEKSYELSVDDTSKNPFVPELTLTLDRDEETLFEQKYTDSGKALPEHMRQVPKSAYVFAALCGIIPIVSGGGAVPAAVGIGGAAACVSVMRNGKISMVKRVAAAIGITVLCWGAFAALVLFVSRP